MGSVTIEIIRDIWELYGVRSNPFSSAPILVKGGIIPLECFVGRNEQIKQLSLWQNGCNCFKLPINT